MKTHIFSARLLWLSAIPLLIGCGRISGGITHKGKDIAPVSISSGPGNFFGMCAATSQAGTGTDGSKVRGTVGVAATGTYRTVSGYKIYGSVQGIYNAQ